MLKEPSALMVSFMLKDTDDAKDKRRGPNYLRNKTSELSRILHLVN
jgi:hypothetical protein